MRILVALALAGCAVEAGESCPERPVHIENGTMQCVSNGCAINDLAWDALGCAQIGPWQSFPDCSFRATFRCANGRSATVVYIEERASFEVRGDDCVSSYMLSAETVCE
jgi:hypothetical protein